MSIFDSKRYTKVFQIVPDAKNALDFLSLVEETFLQLSEVLRIYLFS